MADEWKTALPEDMRGSALVTEATSVEAVVKQALDFQSMLGNSIRMPADGASDEQVADFRSKAEKVGLIPKDKAIEFLRPKAQEGYKIDSPPDDSEKIGLTQGQVDEWKKWAFEAGLSPEQFNAVATQNITGLRDRSKATQDRFDGADATLKAKWGEAAFTARKDMALAAIKKFGGDELLARMGTNPDPDVLIAFAEIGKQFTESGMGDITPATTVTESRDEATVKLAEIRANKEHPFNQGQMGPGGKKAYEAGAREVMRLQALAMGKKPGADFMFDRTG